MDKRIILFRGKSLEDNEWYYGYYVMTQCVNHSNHHYIFSGFYGYTGFGHGDEEEVIPETVGQYTGVKDINGKDVYELDKVKMHYFFRNAYAPDYGVFEDEGEIVGIVGIDEFGVYTECNGKKWYWFTYVGDPETQLEVIGTIFDE